MLHSQRKTVESQVCNNGGSPSVANLNCRNLHLRSGLLHIYSLTIRVSWNSEDIRGWDRSHGFVSALRLWIENPHASRSWRLDLGIQVCLPVPFVQASAIFKLFYFIFQYSVGSAGSRLQSTWSEEAVYMFWMNFARLGWKKVIP